MKHEINLPSMHEVVARAGTGEGGRAQMYFTNELRRISDKYVPMQAGGAGVLKNSGRIEDGGTAITYNTPYARYLWYGNLMIDPLTGSSWARLGAQKTLDPTGRQLKYAGSPIRGKKWTERAFLDNKEELIKGVEQVINQ